MIDIKLQQTLKLHQQQHVLQFWNQLSDAEQKHLVEQISHVDWKIVDEFLLEIVNGHCKKQEKPGLVSPPKHVIRIPQSEAESQVWNQARRKGETALRSGKVCAVLLAGGQGTRLGFALPKGMYPIGPVSGNSLFEILAGQIVALQNRFGCSIPYLVMTSDGTHDETISFFQKNSYFGLKEEDVYFFQQGYSPCIDSGTGKLLLAGKGSLRMSPDGHGGLLGAILKAGIFDVLSNRGVEYVFSHQVDNPLAKVCDPFFIGLHIQAGADVSTKVVAKTGPEEKVGVAVDINDRTAIIEYSDLSSDLSQERDATGELRYWAGSTAIHVFNRSFLERIAKSDKNLPWHRAFKKIPYIDDQGNNVQPPVENGVKFERFLFDTLPLAETALIVETNRSEEFAPLKNSVGDYSPEYVRRHLVNVARNWLNNAGAAVSDDVIVEISPQFALSADDVKQRLSELPQTTFNLATHFCLSDTGEPMVRQTSPGAFPMKSSLQSTDPLVFDSFYRPQI